MLLMELTAQWWDFKDCASTRGLFQRRLSVGKWLCFLSCELFVSWWIVKYCHGPEPTPRKGVLQHSSEAGLSPARIFSEEKAFLLQNHVSCHVHHVSLLMLRGSLYRFDFYGKYVLCEYFLESWKGKVRLGRLRFCLSLELSSLLSDLGWVWMNHLDDAVYEIRRKILLPHRKCWIKLLGCSGTETPHP